MLGIEKCILLGLFAISSLLPITGYLSQSTSHPNNSSGSDSYVSDIQKLTRSDSTLKKAVNLALGKYGSYSKVKRLSEKIVIIDFTKPSNEKRFYVFDLNDGSLLHLAHVAHGKNSGMLYAETFSNKPQSYCSSLGFYRTAETYHGKHGLSMRLDGLEKDINDRARDRAIVIHSAKYANKDFLTKYGRLGRSYGCPTLPEENFKAIIDIIKEGSLLFIYHPDYLSSDT